ncbi:MAG: Hsp33 family molecular chaperone HslO [Desulfatitalea sp.]|nr:Hsp33 family molecular chaperone HslO [Desulfatitalea sp.]NNK02509.1 Hsp33 family molecular chaperone HslO [Desulfatitalea sp.]
MEKKKRYGETVKAQLLASTRDKLYHFMMAGETLRGAVVNGTRMVNEMRWNHELGVLETLVLGHAYLAAVLLSAGLKGKDRLSIGVECSGPIKGLSVEANAYGEVRGYLKQVPIPIQAPLESFNLSPFFGAGFLSVTRYPEGAKHPFTGKVMMENGSLAKDLALYHLRSEQIPTSFSLSVVFDANGEVQGAGGLFLQAMPGAEDQTLAHLEALIKDLPSLGHVVNAAGFPEQWLADTFGSMAPRLLGRRGVEFMCHCNRDHIRTMLRMLNRDELAEMGRNGPFPVQIKCHNCNTDYRFEQDELIAMSKRTN